MSEAPAGGPPDGDLGRGAPAQVHQRDHLRLDRGQLPQRPMDLVTDRPGDGLGGGVVAAPDDHASIGSSTSTGWPLIAAVPGPGEVLADGGSQAATIVGR